jgi:hypothetical protein
MATTLAELELEALPELEGEYEALPEGEGEWEYELEGEGELEGEYEGELEGEFELEGEYEGEYELEGEYEGEYELNPIRRVYPDALMEHLVHEAMGAQTEQEVEQFLPALMPLAMKGAPMLARFAPRLLRFAPRLGRGLSRLGRSLWRRRRRRGLMRTLPLIARNTVHSLTRPGPGGAIRPITADRAMATLRREATRVLRDPQMVARANQRSRNLDRQYHRRYAPRSY